MNKFDKKGYLLSLIKEAQDTAEKDLNFDIDRFRGRPGMPASSEGIRQMQIDRVHAIRELASIVRDWDLGDG